MAKEILVRTKPCNQCLFSENKVVSEQRKKAVLNDCWAKDTYFVCHKNKGVCCAGFYEKNKHGTGLLKLAKILNKLRFVED